MKKTEEERNPKRILIIDDEINMRKSLAGYLEQDGFETATSADAESGLKMLDAGFFSALILDLRLPGMDGLEMLSKIRGQGMNLPVIMISAHGDIEDAVKAMKLGANDYLVKPFDPAELLIRLEKALEADRLGRSAVIEKRLSGSGDSIQVKKEKALWPVNDPAMREILHLATKVAPTGSTVLITGESGSGKELLAREIHRMSRRAEGAFVPVNIAAVHEELLESELFGHERGAFTGAESRKTGLFELASGGTLFLDELGEMTPRTQVKLLRVLQDRQITRLGSTRPIPIDVRIIAATNRNIEDAVKDGSFRKDLYFRLNVIRLRLPPLRERPSDIPDLANFLLAKLSAQMGRTGCLISREALELLCKYTFPGNIRELENILERALILCRENTIHPEDLAVEAGLSQDLAEELEAGIGDDSPDIEPPDLQAAEKLAIISALERNSWHREKTANELGISRRTLLEKIKKYELKKIS